MSPSFLETQACICFEDLPQMVSLGHSFPVRVGPWRLSSKELMLSNCGAGEDSWESLKQQGDQTSQFKGNQPWIFIRRTDIEAAVLWLPDTNSQLIGKDPDAGKDWSQEKAVTEDEMVGLYHWLNEHKFVQTLGDGEGQGSLVCCSPWGHKESDTT